jgi:CheY-like chemotaxis protein
MGKILLVEDDNNLREIYGARLSAEGHQIVSARDGEEALAVAVKEKPDLIIADIMMPRISGFDMLDILRNAPETKNTKIIMMTALSQQEDKEHAEKLGADKYLVKSQVTLEDVAKIVREILDKSKSEPSKDNHPDQQNTSLSDVPPPPSAPKPAAEQASASQGTPPSDAPEPEPSTAPTPEPAPVPEPKQTSDPIGPMAPMQPAPATDDSDQAKPEEAKSDADDTSSPQKSSSISIPVVESAQPEQKADNSPKPTEDNEPKKEAVSPGQDVGPDLAQALAEEEKQVKDQIKDFEKDASQPSGGDVISPTSPQPPQDKDEPEQTAPKASDTKDGKADSVASDGTANKRIIIQPINDLSKKPNLQALADKEEAAEAATGQIEQDKEKPKTDKPGPGNISL